MQASDASVGPELVASCDGARDGTPCGDMGRNLHCLFDACVANACGDGIKAGLEECDDGNERDRDGCDSRCRVEPAPGCGNGVKEPGEECDDGNLVNRDQCTEHCTVARCGDGIVSLGEECDDGNKLDEDGCSNRCRPHTGGPKAGSGGASAAAGRSGSPSAPSGGRGGSMAGASGSNAGSGGMETPVAGMGGVAAGEGGSGSATAGMGGEGGGAAGMMPMTPVTPMTPLGGPPSAACMACRSTMCIDYQMSQIDLVAGCYTAVNSSLGAMADDATFNPECVAVVDCAYRNNCAAGVRGLSECYCGSATDEACAMTGPAPDAKCVASIQAAARTTDNTELSMRFSNFAYPVGWAFFLLECDHSLCAAACGS